MSSFSYFFIQSWVVQFPQDWKLSVVSVIISSFNLWKLDRIQGAISIPCICWYLLCVLGGQLWRKFHVVLRRMCIPLCLGEILCEYMMPTRFMTSFSSTASLFSFCLDDLFISKSMVLKLPTINVWEWIYTLRFTNVSFMNLGTLVFGKFMLKIAMSKKKKELQCSLGWTFFSYEYVVSFTIFSD